MAVTPDALTAEALAFLTERHLASLTTQRADGRLHVVPVGFTWEPGAGIARVISRNSSQKARNAANGGAAVLCQVDGARWLTLEGTLALLTDPVSVADAEDRYGVRYRQPQPNPERVVIAIKVERVLGSDDITGQRSRNVAGS